MTREQLEKGEKILKEIHRLPSLSTSTAGTSTINIEECHKLLILMYPNTEYIRISSTEDVFLGFSAEDTKKINALIEAKREQLENELKEI